MAIDKEWFSLCWNVVPKLASIVYALKGNSASFLFLKKQCSLLQYHLGRPNVKYYNLVLSKCFSRSGKHEVNTEGKEVKHNTKQSTKGLDKKGHGTNIPYLCALRLYV